MSIIDTYRPYQYEAHRAVQAAFKQGHRRIVLGACTGMGKTRIASGMIERCRPESGHPVVFIVPKITLINQAARSFHGAGFEVGVVQAGHPGENRFAPVQVCSVQTLARRGLNIAPKLIIVDEAHILYRYYFDLFKQFPDVPVIGLTATPTKLGMNKLYTALAVGPSTGDLVEQGWLIRSKVFEPSVYSTEGVSTAAGEYNQRELWETVQNQKEVLGDVVENWLENGENRPTICFPVNKLHSMQIAAEFEENGICAAHIQDNTSSEDREAIFSGMRDGKIKVITSVGCLSEGLDLTNISCLIMARPIKSLELMIQQAGRGLRPLMLDGHTQAYDLQKQDCLFFDHGGNYLRLMHHEDYAPDRLNDGKTKIKQKYEKDAEEKGEITKCSHCAAIKPRGLHKCPYCGHSPRPTETGVETVDTRLVMTSDLGRIYTISDRKMWYQQLKGHALESGYKVGWAAYAYKEKFKAWPPRGFDQLGSKMVTDEGVFKWIQHFNIKRAHAKRSAK